MWVLPTYSKEIKKLKSNLPTILSFSNCSSWSIVTKSNCIVGISPSSLHNVICKNTIYIIKIIVDVAIGEQK